MSVEKKIDELRDAVRERFGSCQMVFQMSDEYRRVTMYIVPGSMSFFITETLNDDRTADTWQILHFLEANNSMQDVKDKLIAYLSQHDED